jgi:DHA2 family multidrug resistance protein
VRFALFKDRNYAVGCVFMAVMGISIFATMALVTPFMQNVLGYPIITAGLLLASRGFGTLLGMLMVGRVVHLVEARNLIFAGLFLTAATLHQMSGFTDYTSAQEIVVVSIVQGFGLALVFIPLNTVAFATLPAHLRTDGTAIFTLIRNIASAVGISIVIATLTRRTTVMHANLTEYVTPFNDALKMPDVVSRLDLTTDTGRAIMDAIVTQQASIIAYANDFRLLMWVAIVAMPFVFLVAPNRQTLRRQPGEQPVHAMD